MSEPPHRTPPHRRWPGRAALDSAFPTVLRYGGFCLMIYAALIDQGRNPALIPAATGMIFFKTIYGGGSKE